MAEDKIREIIEARQAPGIRIKDWSTRREFNHDTETVAELNRKQLKTAEAHGHFEDKKLAADMGMTSAQYKDYMHKKMVLDPKRQRKYTWSDFDMKEP